MVLFVSGVLVFEPKGAAMTVSIRKKHRLTALFDSKVLMESFFLGIFSVAL